MIFRVWSTGSCYEDKCLINLWIHLTKFTTDDSCLEGNAEASFLCSGSLLVVPVTGYTPAGSGFISVPSFHLKNRCQLLR